MNVTFEIYGEDGRGKTKKIFDLTIIKYTIRLRSMFLAHKYNYKTGVILCPYR